MSMEEKEIPIEVQKAFEPYLERSSYIKLIKKLNDVDYYIVHYPPYMEIGLPRIVSFDKKNINIFDGFDGLHLLAELDIED